MSGTPSVGLLLTSRQSLVWVFTGDACTYVYISQLMVLTGESQQQSCATLYTSNNAGRMRVWRILRKIAGEFQNIVRDKVVKDCYRSQEGECFLNCTLKLSPHSLGDRRLGVIDSLNGCLCTRVLGLIQGHQKAVGIDSRLWIPTPNIKYRLPDFSKYASDLTWGHSYVSHNPFDLSKWQVSLNDMVLSASYRSEVLGKLFWIWWKASRGVVWSLIAPSVRTVPTAFWISWKILKKCN